MPEQRGSAPEAGRKWGEERQAGVVHRLAEVLAKTDEPLFPQTPKSVLR